MAWPSIAALVALLASSFGTPEASTLPDCPGDVVTVIGWDTFPDCDVDPPQMLNVLPATPASLHDVYRCNHSGGRWMSWPVPMCLGVDF